MKASQRPTIENFNTSVLPAISSQFSASGRYGSGAQQFATTQAADALSRNLADSASNVYANNYAQERGLMENATGQLAGLGQAEAGIRQGAAGMYANLGQGEAAIRQNSAAGLGGIGQAGTQAIQNAGQGFGQLGQSAGALTNQAIAQAPTIGSAGWQQQVAQAGLQGGLGDQYNQYLTQRAQDPYQRLAQYQNVIQGMPNLASTTQGGAGGGGGAGGALQGAAGGAMMGGATFGPWGALAGGLLGGASGAGFF